MDCVNHGWIRPNETTPPCPWCQIKSLQAELDRLKREISARDRMIEEGQRLHRQLLKQMQDVTNTLDHLWDSEERIDLNDWIESKPTDYMEKGKE